MENTTERRLFERLPAQFPTRLRDSSPNFGTDVFLKDISGSGARITTKEQFFLGDIISLEILLPDGQSPLFLNGQVCWIKQVAPRVFEAGLQFHKVNLLKMHRLVKFAIEVSQN